MKNLKETKLKKALEQVLNQLEEDCKSEITATIDSVYQGYETKKGTVNCINTINVNITDNIE